MKKETLQNKSECGLRFLTEQETRDASMLLGMKAEVEGVRGFDVDKWRCLNGCVADEMDGGCVYSVLFQNVVSGKQIGLLFEKNPSEADAMYEVKPFCLCPDNTLSYHESIKAALSSPANQLWKGVFHISSCMSIFGNHSKILRDNEAKLVCSLCFAKMKSEGIATDGWSLYAGLTAPPKKGTTGTREYGAVLYNKESGQGFGIRIAGTLSSASIDSDLYPFCVHGKDHRIHWHKSINDVLQDPLNQYKGLVL